MRVTVLSDFSCFSYGQNDHHSSNSIETVANLEIDFLQGSHVSASHDLTLFSLYNTFHQCCAQLIAFTMFNIIFNFLSSPMVFSTSTLHCMMLFHPGMCFPEVLATVFPVPLNGNPYATSPGKSWPALELPCTLESYSCVLVPWHFLFLVHTPILSYAYGFEV